MFLDPQGSLPAHRGLLAGCAMQISQTIRSISLAYVKALSMSSLDGIDAADFSSTCRKVILPSFTSHSLCVKSKAHEHITVFYVYLHKDTSKVICTRLSESSQL